MITQARIAEIRQEIENVKLDPELPEATREKTIRLLLRVMQTERTRPTGEKAQGSPT